MKVRVEGTPAECERLIAAIRTVLDVEKIDGPYPNHRGPAGEVRYYLPVTGTRRYASEPGA